MCNITAGACTTAPPCCRRARNWMHTRGGRRARARLRGKHGDRLRGARLPRQPAEILHGRLGAALHQHIAQPARPALPRRRNACPASISRACARTAWRRCGKARRSAATAAPTGCRSPAKAATGARVDWGGCRCQAFAITGDAGVTDPACELSPDHHLMAEAAQESTLPPPPFVFRRMGSLVGA